MHRTIVVACFLLIVTISTPAGAGDPIKLENIGPVFGGAHVMANASGESTLELDNLPCIVEDYTATWCSNCVDVEHALADIKNDTGLQLYMMHRYFGEQQDPFGTELSDLRWQDRYESRLPPMVVFNGTMKQSGSVPSGNSLGEDYTKLAQETLQIGEGNSSLIWSNETSTASWHIHGVNVPENGELISMIWVVEKMGYFEEGGNKEEYYPDIVREIIYLDNAMNGSMTIDLPAPWDDDDLELHLIHQINLTVVDDPVPISVAPEESGIPGFIGHFALFALAVAAIISRQKHA